MVGDKTTQFIQELREDADAVASVNCIPISFMLTWRAAKEIERLTARLATIERETREACAKIAEGVAHAYACCGFHNSAAIAADPARPSNQDEPASEHKRPESGSVVPNVEIRKIDDAIDEICIDGCSVHIEQMDNSGWFMGVEAPNGDYWQFWFGAKNYRSHVIFRHTEFHPSAERASSLPSPDRPEGE